MFVRSALRYHSIKHKMREAVGVAKKSKSPFIIGVCGGSGSGKTTFCDQLLSILGPDRAAHLSQDDYYRDLSHLSEVDRANANFDHPDSIEFPLLSQHLDLLSQGHPIAVPKYDFASHTRTTRQQIVSPKPVVLVEGILLFSDESTAQRLDLRIFIDAREHIRFDRRLHRDVRERGRTVESVKSQFSATVLPMHNAFVEPRRLLADRVISGEEPFEPTLIELTAFLMKGMLG
jgi:uridine kinase